MRTEEQASSKGSRTIGAGAACSVKEESDV